MSFGAELVARVLGLPEIPDRAVRRIIGYFLMTMALVMPITFRHGLELYAQRESQVIIHRFIDPMLARLSQLSPAGGASYPTPLHPGPTGTGTRR